MTATPDRSGEVAAALAGDEAAFAALTERHRRALHVHCYRLLASFDEAEDAVQDAFLHAWRSRESFDGGPLFRAFKLDVLRIEAGALAEITAFGPSLFPHFGLPPDLE